MLAQWGSGYNLILRLFRETTHNSSFLEKKGIELRASGLLVNSLPLSHLAAPNVDDA